MPRCFIYLFYNLLLPIVLLIGLPSFLAKGFRRGGLARNFRQRLGFFSRETRVRFAGEKPIWIHAVSVGEIFVALKIVEAIQAASPDKKIVLSTTTTTGFSVASEQETETLVVIHNPVDLPLVTSRVIRQIDPEQLVLVEAEIWPNLVGQLKRRGVPVKLVNARLSSRSESRYLKFLPLVRPIFSMLDAVSVPFEIDRKRWSGLGIPIERISVLGSVKFDNGQTGGVAAEQLAGLRDWLASTAFPPESRILLGGSTHDGEEVLLAEVVSLLQREFPDLRLVLVPRHAERGSEIAEQLQKAGFAPILKTAPDRETSDAPRVWIANTTGELRSWFHLAEIVVIGKSFTAEGGQNPVEPILAGKPTLIGPNMQNFTDVVADLIQAAGLRQVESAEVLAESLQSFLQDPESGRLMAERGATAMARHEGSAQRTAQLILDSVAGQDGSHQPT